MSLEIINKLLEINVIKLRWYMKLCHVGVTRSVLFNMGAMVRLDIDQNKGKIILQDMTLWVNLHYCLIRLQEYFIMYKKNQTKLINVSDYCTKIVSKERKPLILLIPLWSGLCQNLREVSLGHLMGTVKLKIYQKMID